MSTRYTAKQKQADKLSDDNFRAQAVTTNKWSIDSPMFLTDEITAAPVSTKPVVKKMRKSWPEDLRNGLVLPAATRFISQQNHEFNEFNIRLIEVMRSRVIESQHLTWLLKKRVWSRDMQSTQRVVDRSDVMHLNQLAHLGKISWTNKLVLTAAQRKTLPELFDAGWSVWTCFHHNAQGATAIGLRNAENWVVLYEDGSVTKGNMQPRFSTNAWPLVAKIKREHEVILQSALGKSSSGSVVIDRYQKG